jgi:hypothetical protein
MDYLNEVDDAISKINIYNIYGECYGGAPDYGEEEEDSITYI